MRLRMVTEIHFTSSFVLFPFKRNLLYSDPSLPLIEIYSSH